MDILRESVSGVSRILKLEGQSTYAIVPRSCPTSTRSISLSPILTTRPNAADRLAWQSAMTESIESVITISATVWEHPNKFQKKFKRATSMGPECAVMATSAASERS